MSDIIQLLPDVVANQIAAGEVIQRPSSALKELMENSMDSGSRHTRVVIREAGKALIQVIDNGCGMSDADARMCFERYATSKIRKAADLFAIRTMGFRGEALASIAAIAHVELKTKRQEDETGIQLVIEGGEFVYNQPIACNPGTSIAVKNLFFNVPARRNFLKSNAAEMRHIIEEFQRIGLAHPDKEFSLHHNETEVFNLKPGNLRQRIAGVFGSGYNEKLVPVEEETTLINIHGFIGKPEFARKSRGEQYFFVNNRFIKDPYLHHAVTHAFEDLLPAGSYPSYFLFLEIDPSKIDVNIHPTKTEIKFEDDKSVYAILRASVKRALGRFSLTPTLDFEQEPAFQVPLSKLTEMPVPPKIQINPSFNPFKTDPEIRFPSQPSRSFQPSNPHGQDWSKLYQGLDQSLTLKQPAKQGEIDLSTEGDESKTGSAGCFQLANSYIVLAEKDQLVIIDQQAAHEQILFEKNMAALNQTPLTGRHLLFPLTIEMSIKDYSALAEMKDELKALGFDMNEFGKQTFVIHGIPQQTNPEEIKDVLESIAGQYQEGLSGIRMNKYEKIAKALAIRLAVRHGKKLQEPEIKQILEDLGKCAPTGKSPSGHSIFIKWSLTEIEKKFC